MVLISPGAVTGHAADEWDFLLLLRRSAFLILDSSDSD